MKQIRFVIVLFIFISGRETFSQPFADIMSFSYQTFSGTYEDSSKWKNKTDNYFLNFFLPKEFKNGHTLLIRLNSELINSTISPDSSYSSRLASVSMPFGFQLATKNKKWKTVLLAVPKIASDFKDAVDEYDMQIGGIFLQNYIHSEKLKIKAGLYYNREAFGNFFVPLLGIDWKVNDRINLYGIIPTSYKMEFNIVKEKLYAGINFKSLTRSFRLSKTMGYDYVRYDEMQLKVFVDCFVYKKFLLFGEVGYTIGKSPWQYTYNTKEETYRNPVYNPVNNYLLFNVGIAYRVRLDFEKKE